MIIFALEIWRGARVVEGSGLENRRAFAGPVGSNPTLSAIMLEESPLIEGFSILLRDLSLVTEIP